MSIGGYNHELHLKDAVTQIINFRPNTSFYDVSISAVKVNFFTLILNNYL